MKSFTANFRSVLTAFALFAMVLVSCKGKKTDAEIQSSINEKISSKQEMKGLNASVTNGVVTLTGQCETEECRKDCAEEVKEIDGVKDVVNNIQIASAAPAPAPVDVAADETLRTSVNDVVKKYNGVQADVNNGVVTLRGEIKRDNLQELIVSLQHAEA